MIWKFLGGLVGGAFSAAVDWIMRRQQRADQIELGQKRQREVTDKAVEQRVEKADEVERRVDAAGDAERDRLRARWTRPSDQP